jgi:hypothetical protein
LACSFRIPATKIRLFVAAAVVTLVVPHPRAQAKAPQNESIRQDDLRADLFFLAGDSLRGRLTDTERTASRRTSSSRGSSGSD